MLIDIDFFKQVNDTHGHLAGDEVLRELSLRIEGQIRDGAVFARFGGEEFAIVAPEMDQNCASELAEACRAAVAAQPFDTSAGLLEITASFGIASPAPEELESRESILETADTRLYEAKRAGRNRVVAG